jgi:hypothetical protein
MVMREFLEHPPHFLSRLRGASITPIRARQIHPRECKIGETRQHRLQSGDALDDLVLVQQCSAQEPKTIRISGVLSTQYTKPALGAGGTARAQCCVGLAKALGEGISHVVGYDKRGRNPSIEAVN